MFKLFRKRTARPVSAAEARILAYNESMRALALLQYRDAVEVAQRAAAKRDAERGLYTWYDLHRAWVNALEAMDLAYRVAGDAGRAASPRLVARDADGLPVMFRFA